jgi:hypothetical protein
LLAGIGNFNARASPSKDGDRSALALNTLRVATGVDSGGRRDIAIANAAGCPNTPSRIAHAICGKWNYSAGKILRVCHCGADMDRALPARDNNQRG